MKRVMVLLLALAPLLAVAQATDPLTLFNRARGGNAEALSQLRTAAEAGDAAAQFHLGRAFSFGAAVARNDATAAEWVEKAARQGHAEAQSNLGYIYSVGLGVPRDAGKALEWWTRAAEGGFVQAQFNLGLAYWQGRMVPRDDAKAFVWMRKAAEQGVPLAQYDLGLMYSGGEGTPADPVQAASWFRKAAEQGHEPSAIRLAAMHVVGEGVAKDTAEALRLLRRPVANATPAALAMRKDICAREPGACAAEPPAPEQFSFEMTGPKVRIVIPDAPPMAMGPHPLRQPHTRFMGSAPPAYTLSVLTPTADPGMNAAECARFIAASLARRHGLKREDVVMRRTNEQTVVMLFPLVADQLVHLKAYLLSGAEGHCVEVHLSKVTRSKDEIAPWFRGFENARIEIP